VVPSPKPFPYSPSLPTATETRKIKKTSLYGFPVTFLNQKKLLLKIDIKLYVFLSVFSVLIYIFGKITNPTK
jgi:hypothetical protein